MTRGLSLRWKLALASVLPAALVFALALGLASALARRVLERELGARLIAVAQATAATLPVERLVLLAPGDETSRTYGHVRTRLLDMAAATGAARIFVVDRAGKLLCDSGEGGRVGTPVPALERDTLELARVREGQAEASTVLFSGSDGQLYKSGYAPVRDEAGQVVAVAAVDASASFFLPLQTLRRELMALGLGGAAVLALALFLLGSVFVSPIFKLVRAARAIGGGDLDTPVVLRRSDELGLLAASLEQMRHALAARDRQLQMMLAGVAHEVRNPLGGMELYAGLLAEDLRERPEQLQLLSKIRRELEYLEVLVDDFLDFARNKPLQREPIDLSSVLAEVTELVEPFFVARRLTLRVPTKREPLPVLAEPAALRRILLNLLKNAAEASPEGGEIVVEVARAGRGLEVSVRDAGPGVPAEKRERIFEPFFSTKEKGTGLGLAFARKLAEAHDGRLELSAGEGGARFVLSLPAYQGAS